jgi:hypothetical protein
MLPCQKVSQNNGLLYTLTFSPFPRGHIVMTHPEAFLMQCLPAVKWLLILVMGIRLAGMQIEGGRSPGESLPVYMFILTIILLILQ